MKTPTEAQMGSSSPTGPRPVQPGGPELLIGGRVPRPWREAVDWALDTWQGAWAQPQRQDSMRVLAAWQAAERPGRPRFVGLVWYALGLDAAARPQEYLLDYFADLGPHASPAHRLPLHPRPCVAIWMNMPGQAWMNWSFYSVRQKWIKSCVWPIVCNNRVWNTLARGLQRALAGSRHGFGSS